MLADYEIEVSIKIKKTKPIYRMNPDRLKLLLEYYRAEPNDPFNIYALGIEYRDHDPQESLKYFEILIENAPDYVPTYYHLANLYVALEMDEKARVTFENGIARATAQNEELLLREIKSSYDEFMMDY